MTKLNKQGTIFQGRWESHAAAGATMICNAPSPKRLYGRNLQLFLKETQCLCLPCVA